MDCPICYNPTRHVFQKYGYWINECINCFHRSVEMTPAPEHTDKIYQDEYFMGVRQDTLIILVRKNFYWNMAGGMVRFLNNILRQVQFLTWELPLAFSSKDSRKVAGRVLGWNPIHPWHRMVVPISAFRWKQEVLKIFRPANTLNLLV